MALKSSLTGLLLVALYYLLAVFPLVAFDKYWNKNQGRMALSMSSIAAFSMSIPPFVSQFIPMNNLQVSRSISQIAFAVIISSFLTPYLFKTYIQKEKTKDNFKKHIIDKKTDTSTELINQMANIEWKAGAFLSKKIRANKLSEMDRIVVLTDRSGRLVAFASLLKEDIIEGCSLGPFLSTVYVAPDYRGKNISKLLITEIINYAKLSQYNDIFTITSHVGLYEKYGFIYLDKVIDRFGKERRLLKLEMK